MNEKAKRSAQQYNEMARVRFVSAVNQRINDWAERLEQLRRDGRDNTDDWEIAVRMYHNWTRVREQNR